MKEEEISFGEYFDAQRDRLRKMLDNKDAQQHKAWLEEWKRKQGLVLGVLLSWRYFFLKLDKRVTFH